MFVKAKMMKDTIEPYKSWGKKIPFVIESNHPGFIRGARLDWGFLQVAIEDGYTVTVEPFEINKSNCKHEKGFKKTCILRGFGKDECRQYSCNICGADRYMRSNKKLPDVLPEDYKWDDKDE